MKLQNNAEENVGVTSKFSDWAILGVVLVWGANYVVGKYGMRGFDPITFNALRFLGATPILFLLLYFLEKDISVKHQDIWRLAWLGLVGVAIYQCLFMASVKYASATNASLILAASPVFTAMFAQIAKQERLGRKGWRGSFLALVGVVLVIIFSNNKLATGWNVWRGDLFGIVASAVWGLYPVLAFNTLRRYSALKTMTYASLFGTLFLLILGYTGIKHVQWDSVPAEAWFSLFFSVGPVTVYGLVVWYHKIAKVGANRVMAYMYAVPAVAVVTAALLLGEKIHLMQIGGAIIIFMGIHLVRKDKLLVSSPSPVKVEEQSMILD